MTIRIAGQPPTEWPSRVRDIIVRECFDGGLATHFTLTNRGQKTIEVRRRIVRKLRDELVWGQCQRPSFPQIGLWIGRDNSSVRNLYFGNRRRFREQLEPAQIAA